MNHSSHRRNDEPNERGRGQSCVLRGLGHIVRFMFSKTLYRSLLLSLLLVAIEFPRILQGADDPKKPSLLRSAKEKSDTDADPDAEFKPRKYQDMVLPSAEELLKSKPFDWIVLKNLEVIVTEPIGPRPNTLVRLNADYERYLKGRAPFAEGTERLQERRRSFTRIPLTLFEPGADVDPDYTIETRLVARIEYFEDLLLMRARELIDRGSIPLAYDLLLLVDRRHRENNVRMKEAFDAQKREEAGITVEDDRIRFSVPEPQPLKFTKTWPGFDETYQKLLLVDADHRSLRGDNEAAVQLLEDLAERNRNYPELSDSMGRVIDLAITDAVAKSDFRQARYFLTRIGKFDAQHPIAMKWKNELIARATELVAEARKTSEQGDAVAAVEIIERAAKVWPDVPGLRNAHRELTERHQSVRLGVVRLPATPTSYPFETFADSLDSSLTRQLLFEPIRVDERGVRYRSTILDSWEPMDLGRQVQFNVRLSRADWESRAQVTSADILDELLRRIDPAHREYDERLASVIEGITVQSPSQFCIQFRRLPLRLESLFQFGVSLDDESRELNQDLDPAALSVAGTQRFYEFNRDQNHVAYRRVRPQPAAIKARNVDEVVFVRYESWERLLQGMLRGEIAGIPHVNIRDLKGLQEDARFFVVPYVLPVTHTILFNPRSRILGDTQLRRALTLAIPREELLGEMIPEGVDRKLVRLTATPFPSVAYGYNRLLTPPPHDAQRAAALALTAKKQRGGNLSTLRFVCPPDPQVQKIATEMIENWRRVGIAVQLVDDKAEVSNQWDLAYRITRIAEPITELWPLLSFEPEATVESLKPLPDRVRRQLLDLERVNDWTSATKLLHRIETELLVETRYIPLWEEDEFFVTRRHLVGLPPKLMNAFQDVERWTLQSWYLQEAQ